MMQCVYSGINNNTLLFVNVAFLCSQQNELIVHQKKGRKKAN